MSSAEETSATLIPEADHEVVSLLEENGQEAALRNIVEHNLENSEFEGKYDIGFRKDQRTKTHSGTYYSPTEISPYYNGPEEEVQIPIESSVEEFYVNFDGEFRIVDEDGIERTYNLIMSCDDGALLKGEVGFGEREVADFRYMRGEKNNRLQVYIGQNWCRFGNATEIGEGNETMRHIELIESAYKQLTNTNSVEDRSWEINYSSGLKEDLEELPSYIESTIDNKTEEFRQNLELGLDPENMLSAMSHPWKPLLEMRLGSDHRAMFITSANLPQDRLPEQLEGDRNLIGLSVEPKKEFKQKFRSSGNDQIKSGLSYALNSIEKQ